MTNAYKSARGIDPNPVPDIPTVLSVKAAERVAATLQAENARDLARVVRNLPLSTVGITLAAMARAECKMAANGLNVCGDAEWGYLGGGTAYGEIFLTGASASEVMRDPGLMQHEQAHSAQEALMGNDIFALAYFVNMGLAGGNQCKNVFEASAGFEGGGYTQCR